MDLNAGVNDGVGGAGPPPYMLNEWMIGGAGPPPYVENAQICRVVALPHLRRKCANL